MTWSMYRWVWQLRSPLHIGLTPAGALNRTRLYIPARSMWAALTAEIARRLSTNGFPAYKDIGQILQQHARFTYLYPAEKVGNQWLAWLPRYTHEDDEGLRWYRERTSSAVFLSNRRFRQRLLFTQPSTAITPAAGSAEDGTLREVEYIQPFWKLDQESLDSGYHPVAFVGYVFLREPWPSDIENIKNIMITVQELFFGGETRYGFGHMTLIPFSEQSPWKQVNTCFGREVDLTGEIPQIKDSRDLLAHAPLSEAKGDWEVLIRWDWQTMQATNRPLWKPGTSLKHKESFVIQPDGLWERAR